MYINHSETQLQTQEGLNEKSPSCLSNQNLNVLANFCKKPQPEVSRKKNFPVGNLTFGVDGQTDRQESKRRNKTKSRFNLLTPSGFSTYHRV